METRATRATVGWGLFQSKEGALGTLASFLELPILGAHRALLYLLCFEPLEDVMHEEAVGHLSHSSRQSSLSILMSSSCH